MKLFFKDVPIHRLVHIRIIFDSQNRPDLYIFFLVACWLHTVVYYRHIWCLQAASLKI